MTLRQRKSRDLGSRVLREMWVSSFAVLTNEKPLGERLLFKRRYLSLSLYAATSPWPDLHPGWPQLQASSTVSRASWQYWLQYLLPFCSEQLHAGCAHLFFFSCLSSIAHLKLNAVGCVSGGGRVPAFCPLGLMCPLVAGWGHRA